ncbi:MAG: SDR family NAD(P)-dependent oxidoreductase [Methylacidiphilales bacterium]|nr:SDR family NAD(P)-dependent oxidoreductase [Candidatus Methylacidiphilales bacterium]
MKKPTYIVNGAGSSIGTMLCKNLSKQGLVIGLDQNKSSLEQLSEELQDAILIEVLDGTELQVEKIAVQLQKESLIPEALFHCNITTGTLAPLQELSFAEWKQIFNIYLDTIFLLDLKIIPLFAHHQASIFYHHSETPKHYWGALSIAQSGLRSYIEERIFEEKLLIYGIAVPKLQCPERQQSHPGSDLKQYPTPDSLWPFYQNLLLEKQSSGFLSI